MPGIFIHGREYGPYWIDKVGFFLDKEGNPQETQGRKLALCRCGGSANKPFRDITRRSKYFRAPQTERSIKTE